MSAFKNTSDTVTVTGGMLKLNKKICFWKIQKVISNLQIQYVRFGRCPRKKNLPSFISRRNWSYRPFTVLVNACSKFMTVLQLYNSDKLLPVSNTCYTSISPILCVVGFGSKQFLMKGFPAAVNKCHSEEYLSFYHNLVICSKEQYIWWDHCSSTSHPNECDLSHDDCSKCLERQLALKVQNWSS